MIIHGTRTRENTQASTRTQTHTHTHTHTHKHTNIHTQHSRRVPTNFVLLAKKRMRARKTRDIVRTHRRIHRPLVMTFLQESRNVSRRLHTPSDIIPPPLMEKTRRGFTVPARFAARSTKRGSCSPKPSQPHKNTETNDKTATKTAHEPKLH